MPKAVAHKAVAHGADFSGRNVSQFALRSSETGHDRLEDFGNQRNLP
jgi:hypothetical protein